MPVSLPDKSRSWIEACEARRISPARPADSGDAESATSPSPHPGSIPIAPSFAISRGILGQWEATAMQAQDQHHAAAVAGQSSKIAAEGNPRIERTIGEAHRGACVI
jgi:hypothetical protein